jgi:hypothetical protein
MTAAQASDRAGDSSRAVHIVLATYNAAAYLVEQIESIRSQTFTAWTLLIRDDGSSDATGRIIDDYAVTDSRIEVLSDGAGNLGTTGNFSHLAAAALARGASMVFFADQDDVWFPDKVERILGRMAVAEARLGRGRPLLVHTDLQLVDCEGRPLHQSFMAFQRIHGAPSNAVTTLLVQNYVTGCAMAVNRSLLRIAVPVPGEALMHDWWLALCAASCGSIEFLPEPTVSYRRHGTNAVAVRGFWQTLNPFRTDWRQLWRTGRLNHGRAVLQARALARRVAAQGDAPATTTGPTASAMRVVDAFVRLHDPGRSPVSRVAGAIRLGLRSQALPRTLALYLRLLCWRA